MNQSLKRLLRKQNRRMAFLAVSALAIILPLTGCGRPESGALKIYVDGSAVGDTGLLADQFQLQHPEIEITFEVLPQVRHDAVITEERITATLDTDSLVERTAALQRQRTAIMAGNSDGDLFLVSGGISQYDEFNGGALLDDPRLLMSSGCLADLSAIFEGNGALNPEDYIEPAFSAGSSGDALYLVPLGISVPGIIANADTEAVQTLGRAEDATDFFSLLLEQYPQELKNLSAPWNLTFLAQSRPAVDKFSQTLYAEGEHYQEAVRVCEELIAACAADNSTEKGDALIMQSCHPRALSAVAAEASAGGAGRDTMVLSVPDEEGGVTAYVELYAFVPASSGNTQAAVTFLRWMLGEEVQTLGMGSGNAAMLNTATTFPVRKGCIGAALGQHLGESLGSLGETLPASLTALEGRITAARYANIYDYTLAGAVREYWENPGRTLEEEIAPLLAEWRLYLDE